MFNISKNFINKIIEGEPIRDMILNEMADINIKMSDDGKNIEVKSPYNPNFVKDARLLGGKFNRERYVWVFPSDIKSNVEELLDKIYGYYDVSGSKTFDKVNVRIKAKKDISDESLTVYFAGLPIVRAFGRDSGARVQSGISLLSGNITSGGSMKHPSVRIDKGTIFLVRDVHSSKAVADENFEIVSIDKP